MDLEVAEKQIEATNPNPDLADTVVNGPESSVSQLMESLLGCKFSQIQKYKDHYEVPATLS